jgi:hypothetical protein
MKADTFQRIAIPLSIATFVILSTVVIAGTANYYQTYHIGNLRYHVPEDCSMDTSVTAINYHPGQVVTDLPLVEDRKSVV